MEMKINLKETPKLLLQTPEGEIFVHLTSKGELRFSSDNKVVVILPNGENGFKLELRD